MTRILGIDPGSVITGWGVIEAEGQRLTCVASGALHARGDDLTARLRAVHAGIRAVCDAHRPDEVAVERVFVHRNVDSALKLGQARGAALSATFAAGEGPAISEYSPQQVKQAVSGRGTASKDQVQHMVRTLLGLRGPLVADESDALAVAICHAHARTLGQRLAALGVAVPSRPRSRARRLPGRTR